MSEQETNPEGYWKDGKIPGNKEHKPRSYGDEDRPPPFGKPQEEKTIVNVYNNFDTHEFRELLTLILKNQTNMAITIAELSAKVDTLQTALDEEQQQIKDAIDALNLIVADLKTQVAEGGTAEERQAVADKIDAVIADLKGTIPDEAPQG